MDAIRNRFDPFEWSTRDDWRADRAGSPSDWIIKSLDRAARDRVRTDRTEKPHDEPKVLFGGTVGTGKSTGFWKIANARAKKGDEFVVFVDLVSHFNTAVGDAQALLDISSWEVCFLCGVALIRAAKELGYDWDTPRGRELIQELAGAWSALAGATQPGGTQPPSIDLFAAAKSMMLFASAAAPLVAPALGATATAGVTAGAGLKAMSELAGIGKFNLPIARKNTQRLEDADPLMQNLVDKVNLLLGAVRQWNRQVLLVIDGLDRIVQFERAEALFIRSQMIARIQCPLVVCAPFILRNNPATAVVPVFTPYILHNAPVLDHDDPTKHGPGVAFFRDLFRRRVSDLGAEDIIPEPLLDHLAYYSGGRGRDFVRTIRMLGDRGSDDEVPMATEAMVNDVIKEARQRVELGLDKGDYAVLEAAARDPKHDLPPDEKARTLLALARLLPFPNESELVLPRPAPDAQQGPPLAPWVEQVARAFRRIDGGRLVLVDDAAGARLGALVRGLLREHPHLEVLTEAPALEELPAGAFVVLAVRPEDATWLNYKRPIFSQLSLKCVLWSKMSVTGALVRSAPDFFDWVSRRFACPKGPVPHAVAGLRAALVGRAPGVAWHGTGLDQTFAEAFPGRPLHRVTADRPYEELLAETRLRRRGWIAWSGVAAKADLLRARWAIAESGRRGRVVLDNPTREVPGFWRVHASLMSLQEATRRLGAVGAKSPGRLAALLDLEPSAVALAVEILERGTTGAALEGAVRASNDPGAAVARLAAGWHRRGESSPFLRASCRDGEARRCRESARREQLAKETARVRRGFAYSPEAGETLLHAGPASPDDWKALAVMARRAGANDVAARWELLGAGAAEVPSVFARELDFVRGALARGDLRSASRKLAEIGEALAGLSTRETWDYGDLALAVARAALAAGDTALAASLFTKLSDQHWAHGSREVCDASFQGRIDAWREIGKSDPGAAEREIGAALRTAAPAIAPEIRAAGHRAFAEILTSQGRFSEAERALREALRIVDPGSDSKDRSVARTLLLLAGAVTSQGRHGEAYALAGRARSIAGEGSPDMALALRQVAMSQAVLGDPGAPETAARALDALRSSFGPESAALREAEPYLHRAIRGAPSALPSTARPASPAPYVSISPALPLTVRDPVKSGARARVAASIPAPYVSISRLPVTGRDLFGREHELAWLDQCWNEGVHVASIVAWGGVGKSALVNAWLARLRDAGWRGAERVFGWSFYSQGTDRLSSADEFVDVALRWFGDPDPRVGAPWDKGERLAALVRRQRTILILDGVEPLQWGPGIEYGKLKDAALQAVVKELGAQNEGLCVITTRIPVADLEGFAGDKVQMHGLDHLSVEAGAELLMSRGVKGPREELEAASEEYEGHSLSLVLLGSYLRMAHMGDIRERALVPLMTGKSAHGMMAIYEKWFDGKPEARDFAHARTVRRSRARGRNRGPAGVADDRRAYGYSGGTVAARVEQSSDGAKRR